MDDTLEALLERIAACRKCRDDPDKVPPLPHEPRPVLRVSKSACIAVCGQAPGTRVHASGVPFTDPSGDRLRAWMGVSCDTFYDQSLIAIVPMGFCFPGLDAKGGDLPPRRECAQLWRARVFEQLAGVRLVLLVGSYAVKWHLGRASSPNLTATVADWRRHVSGGPEGGGEPAFRRPPPRYIPLPHPSWRNNAWIAKNPWFEAELLPVLRQEVRSALGGRV